MVDSVKDHVAQQAGLAIVCFELIVHRYGSVIQSHLSGVWFDEVDLAGWRALHYSRETAGTLDNRS